MELLKKLSTKAMGIDAKKIVKEMKEGESKPVFRIAGTAGDVKRGDSNFGPWQALLGSFVAVDLTATPNKVYQAGTAFLPDIVTDMLVKAVEVSDPETGEVSTRDIELDITVGIKAVEKSSVGYEYTVTPNIKLSTVADRLLERMGVTEVKQIAEEKTEDKGKGKGKGK